MDHTRPETTRPETTRPETKPPPAVPSYESRKKRRDSPSRPAASKTAANRLAWRVPAPLLVIAAAFSVQSGAALATTLFEDAGALGAVWLRQLFGALVLLALNVGVLRRVRSRPLWPVVALGCTLALMNSLFYTSIDRIPLGVAVTVEFLGPLGVAVAASRRLRDFLWIVLAAAGIVLLGSPTVDLDTVGLVLALGAAVCWAGYILIGKRLGESWPLVDGLTLAMVLSTILMTPVGVASAGDAVLQPATLGVGVAVGVLASVVPYVLELAALRRVSTWTFGILMSLEPAVAALAGAVFLSQALSIYESLAVVLVVVASIGANFRTRAPIPPSA